MAWESEQQPHARRSLKLSSSNVVPSSSPPKLPLERYARKQKETTEAIKKSLEMMREKLKKMDDRIQRASEQNSGHLTACGNCHLKIGHTKKVCKFSPCQSVFSCGCLSKHSHEKSQRTGMEREISKLEAKLQTAVKDFDNATRAAEKIQQSTSRKIENIIVQENPDKYMSNGLRHWALLQKDVATLQKQLKGKLPSRENVSLLLESINIPTDSQKKASSTMSSQKRLLTEEYAINFPTNSQKKKLRPTSTTTTQEKLDFEYALKLQQELSEAPEEFESENPKEQANQDNELSPDKEFEANAAAALLQLNKRSWHK